MSLSANMLYGYYLKCGVEDSYAAPVARRAGDIYLELQASMRMQGNGKSSKALAAIAAAELILESYFEPGYTLKGAKTPEQFTSDCVVIHSAGTCALAALAYESELFSQIGVNAILGKADQAFEALEFQIPDENTLIHEAMLNKKAYYQDALHTKSSQIIAVGKAMGSKKGLLSKIFG